MTTTTAALPRRRGRFEIGQEIDGYEVIDVDVWVWDDAGDLVTSTLPDGQHAPVLDIDMSIRVSADIDGQPTVLHTQVRPVVALRVASALHALGLVDAEQVEHYRVLARGRARLSRKAIPVAFLLPFPMVALPSRTEGHFHLYIEQALTWDAAESLVEALGGIVDRRWAATRRVSPGLVVRPFTPTV